MSIQPTTPSIKEHSITVSPLQGRYLICAGEPSGDRLAADVIKSIRQVAPALQAFGVVGEHMKKTDIEPIADIKELTVMGFSDVLKQLPKLKMYESRFLETVDRIKPDFIILVDYPGLHLRLAERLKLKGYPIYQIVAPQLWAWKEKRVHQWKKHVDLMLGVMPFEVEFFAKYDLPFQYIGTPQVDRTRKVREAPLQWPLAHQKKVMAFFPGSRRGEFKRMTPAILEIVAKVLHEKETDIYISVGPDIPVDWAMSFLQEIAPERFESFHRIDSGDFELWQSKEVFLLKGHSLELMARADAALVTSGTATLECALTDTPMCVAYITGALNYAIAKKVVTLPYISLVNLVADKPIVKEFVQNFSPGDVSEEMLELAFDDQRRAALSVEFAELHKRLKGDMGTNSATAILEHYQDHYI